MSLAPGESKHRSPPAPSSDRERRDWVEELRREGTAGPAAARLRSYLAQGLRAPLARRGLGAADLEDVVQDALVRILEHLDSFRGDSRFTTWAMAVALRVAFGVLRARRREKLVADVGDAPAVSADATALLGASPEAVELLARRDLLGALRRAIDESLSERQRQAVLGELAGVPSEELARRLGTKRNALYKLHHDARKKLRQSILAAGFSEDEVRRELAAASERS